MRRKKSCYQIVVCLLCMVFTICTATVSNAAETTVTTYLWGSSGETVRAIQEELQKQGYYKGSADGKYGYLTFDAVMRFQKDHKLAEDGITGKKTLEALGITIPISSSGVYTDSTSSNRESEIWLLACLINSQGKGESYLGQVAIGAVVLNRIAHPSFPSTISGVIYQTGAFDAVKDGQLHLTPSKSAVNAARDAMNGWDPVDGAIFYWNSRTTKNKWVGTLTIIKTIGNHSFAKN